MTVPVNVHRAALLPSNRTQLRDERWVSSASRRCRKCHRGDPKWYLYPKVTRETSSKFSFLCLYHDRTGSYKALTLVGLLISTVGYAFLGIYWHGHTNFWESLYIAPGAFGTGVIGSSLFVYLAAGVDESQMAIASTGLYQGQNIGALLGLSLASNVLFSVLRSGLEKRLDGFPDKDMVRRSFPAQLGVKRSTFGQWPSARIKWLRLYTDHSQGSIKS